MRGFAGLVAGVCAFVALAFAVVQHMSPVTALVRGAVVYVIALVLTSLFVSYAQIGTVVAPEPPPAKSSAKKAEQSNEPVNVDS